jgi:hypothetical protein
MGTFPIPPPDIPPPFVASINMISTSIQETPASHDPWILPDPDDYLHYGEQIPLSPVESAYQAIQSTTPSTPSLCDSSPDPFHIIFPTYEMIMSVMSMEDTPWDDGHHHSILFLKQHTIESYQWISTPSTVVVISSVPESTRDVLYEGNLESLQMFTSEPLVLMMNLSLINLFFKNSMMFSLGATKICRVLTPISLCMKLRPTRTLNPFGRDFTQSTLVKSPLSNSKLKKFLRMALSILWL